MFCQFALYILIPQTRQLLTRVRNTSTVVQWSLQKPLLICITNSSPFHIPDNTTGGTLPIPQRINGSMQTGLWTHLSTPKSTKHLPKPRELPADPSCPQPCSLPPPLSLCAQPPAQEIGGKGQQRSCATQNLPLPSKDALSGPAYQKKCCSPSVVVVMQRMETASYLLVLWYLEESLSSCQEGVRCTVWPEICILHFIKIEF